MPQPPDPSTPPRYPDPPAPEATRPRPPTYPDAPPAATPPPGYGDAPPAATPPPAYPEAPPAATPPPAYPDAPPAATPAYPGEPAHHTAAPQYPTGAASHPTPPPYPTSGSPYMGRPPAYPTAAPPPPGQPPAYPGATTPSLQGQPPTYPGATTSPLPSQDPPQPAATTSPLAGRLPACPTAAAHPDPGRPPAYPAAGPALQDGAATAPVHPAPLPAQPQYPGPPTTQPMPYPGPPTTQPMPYPGPLPTQPMPYPAPGQPASAGAVPAQAAHGPSEAPAPDDLEYRHRGARLHVAEHQRGADATAIGRLAVQLPGALVSLALVSSLALGLFGSVVGTLVIVAWVASGLLVFHRPTELAFARHVRGLRPPTQEERARLEPIWHEVTARAGIEPGTYELMVENSEKLNAVAVAGHVVGVTTYSLNRIPSSNLAAVLAHELGHHTGGHAWAGLLGYWYSLPGRIAWAMTRGLARFAIAVASFFSMAATGFLILFMALVAVAAFVTAWYLAIPLALAPYLLAYAGRRGELRADQQAAELGFAHQLAEVLHHFQTEEAATKAALAAQGRKQGRKLKQPGILDRLLSSHPDHQTRLNALQPYLALHR
ncbi:M48 family metalloprotease [Streptomyces puniciscabiei]|uniref:M48 family metalloprotease n=1 Tax=Streptomyces puniciscabiei TaxID=164348 RepID=UPI00332A5468